MDPRKSTNWWAHITNLRESLDQLHSSSQNWVTHGHQSPTPSLQIQVADNPLVCIVSRFLWHGPHLAKSCSINYRPELCKPSASPYLSILSFSEAILILHVMRGGCKPNLWNNQCSQTMFGTYLYICNIYIYIYTRVYVYVRTRFLYKKSTIITSYSKPLQKWSFELWWLFFGYRMMEQSGNHQSFPCNAIHRPLICRSRTLVTYAILSFFATRCQQRKAEKLSGRWCGHTLELKDV